MERRTEAERGQLDEHLQACLDQIKSDFERGIVLVDEQGTPESYEQAFRADKTAGQTWENIEARLLAHDAALLRKAALMPQGACLIGVYPDGTLAIRQRSKKIVKVIKDGKGELALLNDTNPQEEEFLWATIYQVIQAVETAGYHVPADQGNKKRGLVAASEVVTGDLYLENLDPANCATFAVLRRTPPMTTGLVNVVMCMSPNTDTQIVTHFYDDNFAQTGAVLWLLG